MPNNPKCPVCLNKCEDPYDNTVMVGLCSNCKQDYYKQVRKRTDDPDTRWMFDVSWAAKRARKMSKQK